MIAFVANPRAPRNPREIQIAGANLGELLAKEEEETKEALAFSGLNLRLHRFLREKPSEWRSNVFGAFKAGPRLASHGGEGVAAPA